MNKTWQYIVLIIERLTKWLDWIFSDKRKRIKKAEALKDEAIKENDEGKLTAALERLKRLKNES